MKVSFYGEERLIVVNYGYTELDVKIDLYSAWKEWSIQEHNTKYLPAFSVIGGDPITDILNLGTTFFCENGWKIRPFEGNHTLTIYGNLYTRDGSPLFVPTVGNYNVLIQMIKSNLIDTIKIGSGVTTQDKEDIKNLIFTSIIESDLTLNDILKIMFAVLANKSTGGGTDTIIFKDVLGITNRLIATVDEYGNRLQVTLNKD